MGAGSWPPLEPLFRMIPGFSSTWSARECATTTAPAPAAPAEPLCGGAPRFARPSQWRRIAPDVIEPEPDRSRRQELSVREAPEAAAFLVVAFLRVVVLPVAADFLVVDFLAVVFLAVVLRVARFLAGPLARFSASSS